MIDYSKFDSKFRLNNEDKTKTTIEEMSRNGDVIEKTMRKDLEVNG